MENNGDFCSSCKHMVFYDWYNCTADFFRSLTKEEVIEKLKEHDGLKLDEYWHFVRIYDEKRHTNCPFFEKIEELDAEEK